MQLLDDQLAMRNYYNEWDTYAATWIRNLISAGHLPSGDVDDRSIVDVQPDDLRGYRQCHFFCGIGGWPYALRLAGWPDDAEVWTGSCPCQPFSCAGQRRGNADERHLWPAFYRLIAERKPAMVFGEQVSGKDGLEWFSAVRADLEGIGYAVGAADLPACSVGAPHIRRRLFWVAHAERHAAEPWRTAKQPNSRTETERARASTEFRRCSDSFELAHSSRAGLEERQEQSARQECAAIERSGDAGGSMEHATGEQVGISGRAREQGSADTSRMGFSYSERPSTRGETAEATRQRNSTIPANWDDLEWLPCVDGKWRPTKPGLFPVAHGIPGRVGKLRAYGNAIVPQVAKEFIRSVMEL